jgi:hypothetical protein
MTFEFGCYNNPKDVPLSRGLYDAAYDLNMSFSQFLEYLNPTQVGDNTGLDAFERQLQAFGIRTKSDPRFGLPASTGAMFFQPNVPASSVLFPEFINRVARRALLNEETEVNKIVANWDTLQGTDMYRAIYIDETSLDRKKSRVAQMGKFPVVEIRWSEKATTLAKYGVKLQMSYEFMRRVSLPVIEMIIGRIMVQDRIDELDLALKTLNDGDGESKEGSAITNVNLSTLGVSNPDAVNDVTYEAWLRWLHMFNPGVCSVIIGNVLSTVQLMAMPKPSVDPIFFYQQIAGMKDEMGGRPIVANPRLAKTLDYITYDSAPDCEIIGVDPRYALIGYREAGTDLTETQKIIDGQWDEILMSSTVGFSTVFRSATKKLTCNA